MIDVRLLSTINIAHTNSELFDRIETLWGFIEDGTVAAIIAGDEITSLYLTPAGRALLTLPTTSA